MGTGASFSTAHSLGDEQGQGLEQEAREQFSAAQVDQLLEAISLGMVGDEDKHEFDRLLESYKSSLMFHFCGRSLNSEDDGLPAAASISKTTLLDLSPSVADIFLRDKIGIINSYHRKLICRYMSLNGDSGQSAKGCLPANTDDGDVLLGQRPLGRSGAGGRTTLRFISSIDLAKKCITCVRRQVLSTDFAISHRWRPRPCRADWSVVRHTHEDACWEESGECAFIDFDPCALRGSDLFCDLVCKEWTVLCCGLEDIGGRTLKFQELPYKCSLTAEEAANLGTLLAEKKALWCDYVCINQADPHDKAQQMPLMGALYSTACTLVVGPALGRGLPADDYLLRAWCTQERDAGALQCCLDLDLALAASDDDDDDDGSGGAGAGAGAGGMDRVSLRQFVCEMLKCIPIVNGSRGVSIDLGRHASQGQGSSLCAVYEYVRWYNWDHEPLREMTVEKVAALAAAVSRVLLEDLASLYPTSTPRFEELARELIAAVSRTDYDDDDTAVAMCFLRLREAVQCPAAADPVLCQLQMLLSQAALPEDRLYAVWGVPMWTRKQQLLPYPRHADALKMVFKSYPSAEFALYRRGSQAFVPFTYFSEVQDVLLHFLTGGRCSAKQYSCTFHEHVLTGKKDGRAAASASDTALATCARVVVAVSASCVGVGISEAGLGPSRAAMRVVFSKRFLQSLVLAAEVESFCRLCFCHLLYEVGLFNQDNLEERSRLHKHCLSFAKTYL